MPFEKKPLAEPIPGYRLSRRVVEGPAEVWKSEGAAGAAVTIRFFPFAWQGFRANDAQLKRGFDLLRKTVNFRHPQLLTVHRSAVTDDELALVTEAPDRSWQELYQEYQNAGKPGIPRDELLGYLSEVAAALDAIRAQHGLQHFALNPKNLFLVKGKAKVADIGLAECLRAMNEGQLSSEIHRHIHRLYQWQAPVEVPTPESQYDTYCLALLYTGLVSGRFLRPEEVGKGPPQHLADKDRQVIGRALGFRQRFTSCTELVLALGGPKFAAPERKQTETPVVPKKLTRPALDPSGEFFVPSEDSGTHSKTPKKPPLSSPGKHRDLIETQFDLPSAAALERKQREAMASEFEFLAMAEAALAETPEDQDTGLKNTSLDVKLDKSGPSSTELLPTSSESLRSTPKPPVVDPSAPTTPSLRVPPTAPPQTVPTPPAPPASDPARDKGPGWFKWVQQLFTEDEKSASTPPAVPGETQSALADPTQGWDSLPSTQIKSGPPPAPEAPGYLVRRTDAVFPASVPSGRTHLLRVQLLPSGKGSTPEIQNQSVEVTVSLTAENFVVEGQARADLQVPLDGKSSAAGFRLRGESPGPGRIMLDFAQEGRPVGALDLYPEVLASNQRSAADPAPGAAEILLTVVPEPAPDAVIKVYEQRTGNEFGRLRFVLSSLNPKLKEFGGQDGDLGTTDLKIKVSDWVDHHLRMLGAIAGQFGTDPDLVRKTLRTVGYNLYDELLPQGLQDLAWALVEKGLKRILILSDESHIPWELIKPYKTHPETGEIERERDFWGGAFALTRWTRGRPPTGALTFRHVGIVSVQSKKEDRKSPRTTPLPNVETDSTLPPLGQELAIVRTLEGKDSPVQIFQPKRQEVRRALLEGGLDALHIACHGSFGGSTTLEASAIQLEDGPFSTADLTPDLARGIRPNKPLLFFNLCQRSSQRFSLTQVGAWGSRLVQLGCGAFIGTFWPVNDKAAIVFIHAFYEALRTQVPIGEAVMQARQEVRTRYPHDPTWLAYCCFADPMAKIQSSGDDMRPPSTHWD